MLLDVWVPFLPPSSNNIYVRHPAGKGRVLSDKARTFKVKAMRILQQKGELALLKLQENVPYELRLLVFFKQVENKKSTTGARYKKMDLTNVVKLIEDTTAKAVGLDDCHNFRVVLEKHCDPDHPGLYVQLNPVPESEVGLTKEAYDRLRRLEPVRADRTSAQPQTTSRPSWPRPRRSYRHPGRKV